MPSLSDLNRFLRQFSSLPTADGGESPAPKDSVAKAQHPRSAKGPGASRGNAAVRSRSTPTRVTPKVAQPRVQPASPIPSEKSTRPHTRRFPSPSLGGRGWKPLILAILVVKVVVLAQFLPHAGTDATGHWVATVLAQQTEIEGGVDEQREAVTEEPQEGTSGPPAETLTEGAPVGTEVGDEPAQALAPPPVLSLESDDEKLEPTIRAILETVDQRRRDLETREAAVVAEEERLGLVQKEVENKLRQVQEIEGRIEELIGRQKTLEDEKLAQLVKVYESMRPEQAAPFLEGLDEELAVQIFSSMKELKAAKVMAFLNKERGVRISERLAKARQD